ncbi:MULTISPECIES: 4-hydroxy-tetrahydrodipicolinate synthase [unclassified Leeuwenhoekiella]|uniref:4-hydroxy-tetrahydrodipicolinate synthase n=1 Tax=unclassified Leeuwenhoekiella TaxID=2615029 RepID=UPI000C6BAD46|nr:MULTISPECIES: 4-hydroxy-tetrahydrodipicolinate synthase [unclassified Leeuwenhoekiella]MAW94617.1 4-hydroxy-tetrahydrodipicolinate synthase [Leeuwenhoekiella sp.]MBA82040.1 4-hydroxy-tetrahydrodipicolinate synthase [Leeuwenhoekiella sp.]|tara:strand:- start:3359 stop:4240 length:882 start_codon:yes stop_codon:yes gene_type:complete
MQELKGTGVALITPFNEDYSIDFDALAQIIEYNIEGGTDYLVILGTTAENATLTAEEQQSVINKAVAVNAGRLPLVLGAGGNNTAALTQSLEKKDLSAFSAVLSVSPYYNRPSQAGIFAHYSQVAKASKLPVILYNVPGRTGSNVLPETVIKLALAEPNIIGVKEAMGDLTQMMRLIKDRPDGFLVLSGDDMIALPTVSVGGEGVISVLGQGLPKMFSNMIREGLSGNFEAAYDKHYKLMRATDLIFAEGNPAGIKALLAHKGLCKDTVRLPLMSATTVLKQDIATYLQDNGL